MEIWSLVLRHVQQGREDRALIQRTSVQERRLSVVLTVPSRLKLTGKPLRVLSKRSSGGCWTWVTEALVLLWEGAPEACVVHECAQDGGPLAQNVRLSQR